jgi:hypothetical protein
VLRVKPPLRGWVILVAVIALIDFTQRVMVWRERGSVPKEITGLQVPGGFESAAQTLQRLQTWIPFESGAASSSAVSPDALQLKAVSVAAQGARAVLALKGSAGQITRHVRVSVGDEVEGWGVIDIQPRKVVLQREGSSHELLLFRSAGAANGGG